MNSLLFVSCHPPPRLVYGRESFAVVFGKTLVFEAVALKTFSTTKNAFKGGTGAAAEDPRDDNDDGFYKRSVLRDTARLPLIWMDQFSFEILQEFIFLRSPHLRIINRRVEQTPRSP